MPGAGLYDHIGGGFCRYTVDGEWLVPHFEKMLYDNGLFLGMLSEVYRETQNPPFRPAPARNGGMATARYGRDA